jgi:hypothetical protein
MNWFFFIDKREKTENKKKTQPNMLQYNIRASFQRFWLSALAGICKGEFGRGRTRFGRGRTRSIRAGPSDNPSLKNTLRRTQKK